MLPNDHSDEALKYTSRLSSLNTELFEYVKPFMNTPNFMELQVEKNNPYIQMFMQYDINSYPIFISNDFKSSLDNTVSDLIDALVKLITDRISNDKVEIEDKNNITAAQLKQCLNTNLKGQLLTRADVIHDGNDLKVIELNTGSNLGGWDIRFFDQVIRQQANIKDFFTQFNEKFYFRDPLVHLLGSLITTCVNEEVLDEDGVCQFAIVANQEAFNAGVHQFLHNILRQTAEHIKVPVEFHMMQSPKELSFENGYVYLSQKRISCLINPNQVAGFHGINDFPKILDAYLERKLIWTENPISQLLGDKKLLAGLWQEKNSNIFNDKDRAAIESILPYSYYLEEPSIQHKGQTVDLKTFLTSQKNNLVIKPGWGFQGDDVFIGQSLSEKAWAEVVEQTSLTNEYLVQEYIKPVSLHTLVKGQAETRSPIWGVFSFGDEYAGVWIRLGADNSDDTVINSSKGAVESIIYEEKNNDSVM